MSFVEAPPGILPVRSSMAQQLESASSGRSLPLGSRQETQPQTRRLRARVEFHGARKGVTRRFEPAHGLLLTSQKEPGVVLDATFETARDRASEIGRGLLVATKQAADVGQPNPGLREGWIELEGFLEATLRLLLLFLGIADVLWKAI